LENLDKGVTDLIFHLFKVINDKKAEIEKMRKEMADDQINFQ
jgi:hypothetical protein